MPIVSAYLDPAEMQAMRKIPMTMEGWEQPAFRFSLFDGMKEGFLIDPTVVDARSTVATQILSDEV